MELPAILHFDITAGDSGYDPESSLPILIDTKTYDFFIGEGRNHLHGMLLMHEGDCLFIYTRPDFGFDTNGSNSVVVYRISDPEFCSRESPDLSEVTIQSIGKAVLSFGSRLESDSKGRLEF